MKTIIYTDKAPAAIGPYSQAIRAGDLVFISGQIPLCPYNNEILVHTIEEQTRQVFENMKAICEAAGADLSAIVKVNLYLVDLSNFSTVNTIMAEFFASPYPARAAVEVSALPRGALIEAEAVLHLPT